MVGWSVHMAGNPFSVLVRKLLQLGRSNRTVVYGARSTGSSRRTCTKAVQKNIIVNNLTEVITFYKAEWRKVVYVSNREDLVWSLCCDEYFGIEDYGTHRTSIKLG